MPHIPTPARSRGGNRELWLTAAMLLATIITGLMLAHDIATITAANRGDTLAMARIGAFAAILVVLVYGNVVYQISRFGFLVRERAHDVEPFDTLIEHHWERAEPIAVLVPSYREDERTIRQTLLSAALQHHPNLRVTLLLDDPPLPGDADSARQLAKARRIPGEIMMLLRQPRDIVERGQAAMHARAAEGIRSPRTEIKALLATYDALIGWIREAAARTQVNDHTDAHFVDVTWRRHQALLEQRARRFAHMLADDTAPSLDAIERELDRLRDVFAVDITVFQRKRYCNVTHEPNKAANLNTYIDLLGSSAREVQRDDGLHLEKGDALDAMRVPDATYVLTLDADSVLAPDYALRLAAEFDATGNERLAVVQTPYTAIPNSPGVLERIAGATTDIQYIVHQGFTWCGATFWVGANALLRKVALEDIRTVAREHGLDVPKYIQDHTVIEDTESTIDLAERGWELHNVPERLAWSATPPDFGSLLIQRSRWANGGLLILPKLVRQLARAPFRRMAIPSFLVRLHYLSSIATGSLGLLIMLMLPLGSEMESTWLYLLPVPYMVLYGRDLVRSGYRITDLARVFAFNLMLVPIHLAGVLKSIQQGLTGNRVPFGRTPKVPGRTASPRWAVLAMWGMLAWSVMAASFDAFGGRWGHTTFAMVTAGALAYAVTAFVGVRASVEDAMQGWSITTPRLDARSEAAARIGDRPTR